MLTETTPPLVTYPIRLHEESDKLMALIQRLRELNEQLSGPGPQAVTANVLPQPEGLLAKLRDALTRQSDLITALDHEVARLDRLIDGSNGTIVTVGGTRQVA